MKKLFQMIVPRENVSYEAHRFTHEDIDDSLIPVEHLKQLPNPLLLQSYLYVDQKDKQWIAGIVIEENTRILLYEIWLKDGKAIAYEIYVD
ncbi:hypothetical protein CWR48_02900 [Oceanobacillus arenosus]|uniref:Uncharacterized protein n=2 Tax=Oceanobacillus arenosus TaxID=1229153 RepID=A0A3D8PZA5_9BACI|nr:hypothetical protein CWR48_02900 [Oceanobacillus arenosus]